MRANGVPASGLSDSLAGMNVVRAGAVRGEDDLPACDQAAVAACLLVWRVPVKFRIPDLCYGGGLITSERGKPRSHEPEDSCYCSHLQ